MVNVVFECPLYLIGLIIVFSKLMGSMKPIEPMLTGPLNQLIYDLVLRFYLTSSREKKVNNIEHFLYVAKFFNTREVCKDTL